MLIAGGGVAGCLAALALARLRPDVKLLIVEETERFGGERRRLMFDAELDGAEARALIGALRGDSWPGFYVAFPGFSRKLKAGLLSFGPDALHDAMVATLKPDQYRLAAKVVAVRDDALVLDGGEEIKAEGAIDARGASNLSMLELLYESRLERDCRLSAPHRVDRPVLIDAHGGAAEGIGHIRCVPIDADRIAIADIRVSELAQPDEGAAARIDAYLKLRGWTAAGIETERSVSRPLPIGGDFASFWRIGGARVAKLGLRGGFVHPATGRATADAVHNALALAAQKDFSGAALHDLFEGRARAAWKKRAFLREMNAAIAAAAPDRRRAISARLYALDPGLIERFHADRLGLLDRRKLMQALKG
ncbi:MAG: lycopene beta-cyclase CrtY [Sphingomonas sp.]|nr:lycopene beta-cyclase CrtY [Sphingomonas sp.]